MTAAASRRWIVQCLRTASLVALVVLSAPGSHAQTSGRPAALQKPSGLPSHATYHRAITLTPHATELVFAAGAGDRIVATVISSDYPPGALSIPRIGDGLNVSTEKALALRPDLVVAWHASAAALTLAPTLQQLHIPLIYSAPQSLSDIPEEIRRLGELFDTPETANETAQALDARLQSMERQYAGRPPVPVFIEIGTNPLYTVGSDPVLNDALRICGARNVYADAFSAAPQVSAESVLVAQPAVVFTPAIKPANLEAARARWTSLRLPAALQGHVYGFDPDQLFRPGPRLVDATQELCQYIERVR